MSQSKQGSLAHIHLKLQEDCHGTSPQLLWDLEHCLHCGEKNYFTLHITVIKTHLKQDSIMLLYFEKVVKIRNLLCTSLIYYLETAFK